MARTSKRLPDPSGFGTALYDEIVAWVNAHAQELATAIVGDSWDDDWVQQQQAAATDSVVTAQRVAHAELTRLRSEGGAAQWEEYCLAQQGWRECPTHAEQVAVVENACHLLDAYPGLGEPPATPPLRVLKVQWQSPVRCARGTIQYIDILVEYELDTLGANASVKGVTDGGLWAHISLAEEPFPALAAKNLPTWGIVPPKQSRTLGFLIRPLIPTLGPLVREVRMLEEYRPGRYVVVALNTRFQAALESQGITFVVYDPRRWEEPTPDDPTALLLAFLGAGKTDR